jgi:DNA-binding MarR family transcriptional regulator
VIDFTRSADGGSNDGDAPLHLLSTKQRAIVEAIDRYEGATGEPCSASYLARRFSIDWTTVRGHLTALHRKGWLKTANSPVSLRRRPRE